MRILAAGSLRVVWPQLMAAFQADAVCDFGPAGLLRERIEAGEACDFFASANLAHPQALLESGRALRVAPFTTNRLCLSVRAQAMREGEDWLSLFNPAGSADRHLNSRLRSFRRLYAAAFFADGQGGRSGPKTRGSAGWRQADFAVTGGSAGGGMAHQS